MEQACYKCGQLVEQGHPFCPHCSAPQIRVLIPEPVAVPLDNPSATESSDPLSLPRAVPLLPMQWSQAAKPCAIAALIAAVGMVLKLVAPLIAAIGAGFLAVVLYRRQNLDVAMNARVGARIGAVCGFFCFAITLILGAVRVGALGEGAAIRRLFMEAVEQQASAIFRSAIPGQPRFHALERRPCLHDGISCNFWADRLCPSRSDRRRARRSRPRPPQSLASLSISPHTEPMTTTSSRSPALLPAGRGISRGTDPVHPRSRPCGTVLFQTAPPRNLPCTSLSAPRIIFRLHFLR